MYMTNAGAARLDLGSLMEESREADRIAQQTDPSVRERLDLVPAADFPATVATAHVQASWRSHSRRHARSSSYTGMTLISDPELESAASLNELRGLPGLQSIRPIRSLLVEGDIEGLNDLRRAAATLQADMVMVYTFDTKTRENTTVPVVGVASLGILPNIEQNATSRVTGGLIDVRTGYLYGILEAEGEATQLANGWTSDEARGDAALRAERRALRSFVDAAAELWGDVVAEHAPANARSHIVRSPDGASYQTTR
jgi:hypothetical protein